jgi:heterodisulfide reductase subunit D
MSEEYKKAFGSVPFRVRHISQLLYENREGLRVHLRPWKVRVTYHDPCHVGRYMGVYEEPRVLISMVPGVELVEFKYNRKLAVCCGSGGGVRSAFPEIALAVAKTVVADRPAGVEIIVTSCPFCNYNLKEAGSAEIIDLPEFLIRAWRD